MSKINKKIFNSMVKYEEKFIHKAMAPYAECMCPVCTQDHVDQMTDDEINEMILKVNSKLYGKYTVKQMDDFYNYCE